MKRILCILTLLALLILPLASCADPEEPLRIGVLSGTTGIGITKMIDEAEQDYAFSQPYTAPDVLVSDVIAGTVDIAAVPVNAAAALYNRTEGGVRVIAINTLGVMYLLDNTGTVHSLADLAGKTVHVATPGQTPFYILKHLVDEAGILNVNYEDEFTDLDVLATKAATGEVEIALLPEPKVTVALNKAAQQQNANLRVAVDLTAVWDETEDFTLAQGCVVVRTEIWEKHPDRVREFLSDYERSITYMTAPENLDAAAALLQEHGIIPNAALAKKALPRCNIAFISGTEMKGHLTALYQVLFAMDPRAVGGKLPEEEFYVLP